MVEAKVTAILLTCVVWMCVLAWREQTHKARSGFLNDIIDALNHMISNAPKAGQPLPFSRVEAIKEIHRVCVDASHQAIPHCDECGSSWPCATVKELD